MRSTCVCATRRLATVSAVDKAEAAVEKVAAAATSLAKRFMVIKGGRNEGEGEEKEKEERNEFWYRIFTSLAFIRTIKPLRFVPGLVTPSFRLVLYV